VDLRIACLRFEKGPPLVSTNTIIGMMFSTSNLTPRDFNPAAIAVARPCRLARVRGFALENSDFEIF
jgi:hypothetical protein